MHNRFGWVDVSELDARETCAKHPREWTFEAWKRPEGFPDVNVSANWPSLSARNCIDLARQIDASADIKYRSQAEEIIRNYLSATKHPKDVANA